MNKKISKEITLFLANIPYLKPGKFKIESTEFAPIMYYKDLVKKRGRPSKNSKPQNGQGGVGTNYEDFMVVIKWGENVELPTFLYSTKGTDPFSLRIEYDGKGLADVSFNKKEKLPKEHKKAIRYILQTLSSNAYMQSV